MFKFLNGHSENAKSYRGSKRDGGKGKPHRFLPRFSALLGKRRTLRSVPDFLKRNAERGPHLGLRSPAPGTEWRVQPRLPVSS
jgi:hypothetical protein